MRRAVKRSIWVSCIACLGIVALGVAVWLTGNTGPGRKFIERLTYQLTGGYVTLSGLGGSFPEQLTLEELQLRDGHGVWLTADRLALRWFPLELLERRIHVDALHVGRLHMERAPVSGTSGGGSVSIPHIIVGHFAIDAVELGAPLVGTAANFSASGDWQMRSLEDANGGLLAHRMDGEGDYSLRLRLDPKRVDASLAVREPASGPLENLLSLPGLGALTATATLAGPRNAERVDAVVEAGALHAQVHGSIDFMHAAADLDYALDASQMAPRPDVAWTRIALNGNWRGPLTAPQADGNLDVDDLRLAGSTRMLRLTAKLSASEGRLDVRSVITGLEIPGPQPRLFADQPLKIDGSVMLGEASRPVDVTASHPLLALHAHADTAAAAPGGQRARVELAIADLAPFAAFAAQDVRGSATVNAQFVRGPGGITVTMDANLGLAGGKAAWIGIIGPRAAVKMSGMLSDTAIKIQSLRVAGDTLTLTGGGSATRVAAAASDLSIKDLQAHWQLDVPDLSRISSDVAGELTMTGQIKGTPESMAADADVTSKLSVRGSPSGAVDAQLRVRGLPGAPNAIIQAHGTLDGAPLNLDASVDRSAARAIHVSVRQADWKSAHVEGDMTAEEDLAHSRGQLRLHVAALNDFDRLIGMSLAGSADGNIGIVSTRGRPEAQLQLDGKNLAAGPLAGDLHLQGAGSLSALELKLSAQLPEFYGSPALLSAAGTLNVDARDLRIANISAEYRGASLRSLSPSVLSFANGVSVDGLKLGAHDAVFEFAGQLTPALDMHASLAHVGPGLINVFTPGLLASGAIGAQASLQGSLSSPTGSIRVDANAMRFADDDAAGLPALDIHGQAQLTGDTASIDATLAAGSGSKVTVVGTAPINANGALDLQIGGKLDVGLVSPLLEARGLRAAGALTVDATVTGSAGAPVVGGGITLADGSVRDYVRGVNLSNIQARVEGNNAGLQITSFSAKAVSGSVDMTGTFGVLQHGMPVDLRISAKNAQPIASSIITANLDADLHVTGSALVRLDVDGTIHVNRATIGVPDSLPPEVAVLDVRRRGQRAPAVIGNKLVIGFDIAIQAPQQILVQGRGLDAELGGEIRLSGTSDEPVASGGFELQRGSFTIAGNTLSLTPPGRVGFDGEGLRKTIDPTLDFTAQTTVSSATVSGATVVLRITALADAPRFEFTSNPTLPQDEIMALLLFGESAAQLTALQVAQIGAALAILSGVGGGGSNPLVKLQKSLGLDRLMVGSNTTTTATGATENSGAAIAAGRYVSKRVYVEAKQSTAGTSQLQVDIDMTKHLKLQTRLGNGTATVQGTTPENDPGSSVGISYQFEY